MANTQIPSSGIFKPRRNAVMASTLGSTINIEFGGLPGVEISSGTGAYIDIGTTEHLDASKLVILYGTSDTGIASFVVRTNDNPYTGANIGWRSTGDTAVGSRDTNAGLKGFKLTCFSGVVSTAGGYYMAGPFETHAVKDTDGHINFDGTTDQTSAMTVFITPIILP